MAKTVAQDTEDAPHTGFNIPPEAAGAVQIVSWAGTAVHQLHVEGVSDADDTLQGNDAGVGVIRLLAPFMVVDGEADIAWFIRRHHRSEDDTFSGVCRKDGSRRITVHAAIEYLGDSMVFAKSVGKAL